MREWARAGHRSIPAAAAANLRTAEGGEEKILIALSISVGNPQKISHNSYWDFGNRDDNARQNYVMFSNIPSYFFSFSDQCVLVLIFEK